MSTQRVILAAVALVCATALAITLLLRDGGGDTGPPATVCLQPGPGVCD